ncbi:MAG: folate-binding protein [Beijerinckiaceae bacterium]|nr:folate-binding protein [Beijerinckiaceae bacterium]MCI0736938.1 folate-binding protein [Beijerinckiaceae bacterium]
MDVSVCVLQDRGVFELTGADVAGFLQRLITNSVLDIPKGEARYSALLSPQGKLLFDFFVVPLAGGRDAGYLFDCLNVQTGNLITRLNIHKLRAKVTIADKSGEFGVVAILGGEAGSRPEGIAYRDPRAPGMGLRVIATRASLASLKDAGEDVYEAHRIAQGVPKGGVDFAYGDTFIHDANLDLMKGVDFKKGCYVGQEVVARVEFRKSARKRIVKVHFDGPAPAPGAPVMAGDISIGQVGSTAGSEGLAMLRLDRLEEAQAAGSVIKAGDATVDVVVPPELIAAGSPSV